MAQALNALAQRRWWHAAWLPGLLAVCAAPALAQSDPMRPAISLTAPASDAATATPERSEPPGLQSVRIDPRGVRAALINGRWYAEGARIGRMRLDEVRESEVLLRDGRDRPIVMKMFPEVAVRSADDRRTETGTRKAARADRRPAENGEQDR